MDKRKRQWQPVGVELARSRTGVKLLDKFGRDGLLVWTLYLLACKRSYYEGEFHYASEPEGWQMLGLPYPHTPAFSLDDFFTFTGQLKKTRKRRDGHVVKVICTSWGEWKVKSRTKKTDEEKPSKTQENTAPVQTEPGPDVAAIPPLTKDLDLRPSTLTVTEPLTRPAGRHKSVVFDRWLSLSPPLVAHRPTYLHSEKVRRKLAAALKVYDEPVIVKAVENYAAVLSSQHHYFTHRWTFADFIVRGLDKFVDEATPLDNFRERDIKAAPAPPAQWDTLDAERWVRAGGWTKADSEIAQHLGRHGIEGPAKQRLLELARSLAA